MNVYTSPAPSLAVRNGDGTYTVRVIAPDGTPLGVPDVHCETWGEVRLTAAPNGAVVIDALPSVDR